MARPKEENKIIDILADEVMQVNVSTPKHPSAYMLIDIESWNHLCLLGVGRISAHQGKNNKTAYACCKLNGKVVKTHRLLLPDSAMVDHRNGNGLDNRMVNLRACSSKENQANRRISSTNTTGFKGISFHKPSKKFVAHISINGKLKFLGNFKTAEEASAAYKQASLEYHKEFSIYNNQ